MNFEQDIRQHTLACLPYDPSYRLVLEAKGTSDLLILYLGWCKRFISNRPRRVHCSSLLCSKWPTFDPSHRAALDRIVCGFKRGSDLNAHLSKDVRIGFEPPTSGTARRVRRPKHLDLLLNDWGIHHLHLSLEMRPNGFVQGTKPLLFAAIRPYDAYLIDVVDHNAWTKQHVLEVIVQEWPDAGLMIEAKAASPSGMRLSDTQRRNLRSNRYTACFEMGGTVYMSSTGGIMSTGASLLTWMEARQILAHARMVEAAFAKRLIEHQLIPSLDPDIHFAFFEQGYGVVESKTRTAIRLV